MATPVDSKTETHPVNSSVLDSANQIWLAGLGAFAKTQEEGGKVFESLVKQGEELEARTMKAANAKVEEMRGRVEEVRDKATGRLDKLEQVFQDRVARALNRLGVPSNDDIQALIQHVESLDKTVQQMVASHEKLIAQIEASQRQLVD